MSIYLAPLPCRYISATARTTIDTSRTLFIWLISLYLGWETFIWLEVVGFLVLIYGTFLFNGLIPACPAFVTRAMSRRRPAGSVMVV